MIKLELSDLVDVCGGATKPQILHAKAQRGPAIYNCREVARNKSFAVDECTPTGRYEKDEAIR